MLSDAVDMTREVLTDLVAGNWSAVTARFDDQMNESLDADTLAGVWTQVLEHGGDLVTAEGPEAFQVDGLTVTDTVMHFDKEDFVARLAFRDDKTIGGLYFLAPEAAARLRDQQ